MNWPPAPLSPRERERRRRAFAAVAPRLEAAHRERQRELELEREARDRAANAVLKARRLVAHRELQLVRACARGRSRRQGAYIDERIRKLQEGRVELEQALERARRLGVHTGG